MNLAARLMVLARVEFPFASFFVSWALSLEEPVMKSVTESMALKHRKAGH